MSGLREAPIGNSLYFTEALRLLRIVLLAGYSIHYSSLPNGAGGGLSSTIRLSSDDLNSVFCWHCSVLEQNNPNLEAGVRTQPPSNITQWVYRQDIFQKSAKKF